MSKVSSDKIDGDIKSKLISGYEEDLVLSLQGFNVMDKLSRYEIFKTPTTNCDDKIPLWYKRLSSLTHGHVNGTLVTRYVLQQLREPWEWKLIDWEKFLIMLESVGGRAETIAVRLRSQLASENDIVTEANISDIIIQEGHINDIISILAEYADKWEELCVALKLPHNRIEVDCMIKGRNSAVKRLVYVLEERIKKSQPLTLRLLTDALRSRLVSCATAADKLEREFRKTLDESHTNQIPYGRSTLLGAGQYQGSSYEWMKDGKVLYDDSQFDGVNKSVLYIDEVRDSEKYTCHVETGKTTYIKQICLEVVLPKKNSFLVSLYSQNIPTSSWPPVSSRVFITLALIPQSKNLKDSIITGTRIGGENVIEYDKLFGYYKKRVLYFIEGRPGSGKTTLVFKVAKNWATGLALKGASRVYVIPLRILNFHKLKLESVRDLFAVIYKERKIILEDLKEVYSNNGEGACFILDGLDEYYNRNQQDDIIDNIIHKKVLPEAMVIVVSRPIGTAKIRVNVPTQGRVEVLGFTRESVWKYIENYPFSQGDASSKLAAYLKSHANVLHMCYLPVHASIVCYLYWINHEIPETETELYHYFTNLSIMRQTMRDDIAPSNSGDTENHFINICKMAYDMIKNSVQVVHRSDLISEPGSDKKFLGLVVVDAIAELLGYKEMFTFLHLTYQEFLAAWYIYNMKHSNEYREIQWLCKNKQYQVLKFYFGLSKNEDCTVSLQNVIFSKAEMLSCIHCAFESHTKTACELIYKHIFYNSYNEGKLALCQQSIMPLDFTAIAYILSNCSWNPSTIEIEDCYITEEGIDAFISAMSPHKVRNITHLKISRNQFLTRILNRLLNGLHYLENIKLGTNLLCNEDIKTLTKNVTLNSLTALSVTVYITQCDVAKLLKFNSEKLCELYCETPCFSTTYCDPCKDFPENDFTWSHLCHVFNDQLLPTESQPQHFGLCSWDFYQIKFVNFLHCVSYCLVYCNIDDEAMTTITTALTGANQCLTHILLLRLDFNNITVLGACQLATLVRLSAWIKYISVSGNKIDSMGAQAIAYSLESCKELKTLDLQFNRIGDDGAIAIAKATAQMDIKLRLWNSNITECGMKEILKYKPDIVTTAYFSNLSPYIREYPILLDELLKKCYHLRELRVSDILTINENDDFATKVCQDLKYFSYLTHLNLQECHIGCDRAKYLVESLKCLHQLKILNLDSNNLGSSGTITVAGGLKFCPLLEVLHMTCNNISSRESISALADGLKYVPHLIELNLSQNELSSIAGDALVAELPKLSKLYLICCSIDSSDAVSFAKSLKKCTTLQDLDLSDNNLGSGLVDVANTFKYCDLQVLSLNSVKIGLDSARAVSCNFEHTANLAELYMDYNDMDGTTTEVLMDGLKFCEHLRILFLRGNKITPRAAARLSRCLRHGNIKKLILHNCDIDDRGCICLAVGLRCCTKLECLDLSSNHIGSQGVTALANEIKPLNTISFSIYDNPINDTSAIYLMEQLKHIKFIDLPYENLEEETKLKLYEMDKARSV